MAARTAPPNLEKAGKKLWREIAKSYELRPDEYRVLEDACQEADLVDSLAEELRGASVMITGSMGQQVLNPLIAEVRQHRSTLSTLLGKLKLPDESGAEAGATAPAGDDRASKARAAANARWSRRGQ